MRRMRDRIKKNKEYNKLNKQMIMKIIDIEWKRIRWGERIKNQKKERDL